MRTPRATATARIRTPPLTEMPGIIEAAQLTLTVTPAVTEGPPPTLAQTSAVTAGVPAMTAPPTIAPTAGPAVTPEAPATSAVIAANNQLVNPCFDGTHNGDPLGWQQTPGWDVSQNKNPCGSNQSAGRINDPTQAGESGPDRDERIWQVVAGRGAYLIAAMQCVNHFAYYTDMNIYGGDNPNGPWQLVWTPFTLADCDRDRWGPTVRHAETQLAHSGGYAFYKVEFAAMYPQVGPDSGGVKFTNAYFESR
jgi:hypothetical protein